MAGWKHSQWQIPSERGIARACEGVPAPSPDKPPVVSQTLLGSLWGIVQSFLALCSEWTFPERGQVGRPARALQPGWGCTPLCQTLPVIPVVVTDIKHWPHEATHTLGLLGKMNTFPKLRAGCSSEFEEQVELLLHPQQLAEVSVIRQHQGLDPRLRDHPSPAFRIKPKSLEHGGS